LAGRGKRKALSHNARTLREVHGAWRLQGRGDADLESALRRELNEEVGLKPEDYTMSRIEEAREYEDLYHHHPESERYGKNTIIYPFLVHLNALVPLTLQASEIRDAVWLDADAARRALAHAPHMKETFEIGLHALNG